MTNINAVQSQKITVNADGLFQVKGQTVDVMGLIFEIQAGTKKFAENYLGSIAKELWKNNQKTKQLVFFLKQVRAMRPTGDAKATVGADKVKEAVKNYVDLYDSNPLTDFDLTSLLKVKVPEGNTGQAGDLSLSSELFEGDNKLQFSKIKQAQVDQAIEGIKSEITTVNSKEELLNNEMQKYTRLSDETEESTSSIEKSLHDHRLNEESKV